MVNYAIFDGRMSKNIFCRAQRAPVSKVVSKPMRCAIISSRKTKKNTQWDTHQKLQCEMYTDDERSRRRRNQSFKHLVPPLYGTIGCVSAWIKYTYLRLLCSLIPSIRALYFPIHFPICPKVFVAWFFFLAFSRPHPHLDADFQWSVTLVFRRTTNILHTLIKSLVSNAWNNGNGITIFWSPFTTHKNQIL